MVRIGDSRWHLGSKHNSKNQMLDKNTENCHLEWRENKEQNTICSYLKINSSILHYIGGD